MKRPQPNIYWFLLDGLSPWFLNACGHEEYEENFFDTLLRPGTVFSNVFTTDGGTHTSLHSIFSSLLPSYNGATGWVRKALRRFDRDIDTFTDRLKQCGYATYRYCDADRERTVPHAGFDVWESSGYPIGTFLQHTDLGDCPRRRRFVRLVNEETCPKFVYEHIEVLHDLNGVLGNVWPHEAYARNIRTTAEAFERLYRAHDIQADDYVILSSDHGVMLDVDWPLDGVRHGERMYEISSIAFFAVRGPGIRAQVLPRLVGAMDEAPTLLDLLGAPPLSGQGRSQRAYMERGAYAPQVFVREKGTFCVPMAERNPDTSDLFALRDGPWKYVYSVRDPRSEWLMDLQKDGDYEVNLLSSQPQRAAQYKNQLQALYAPDAIRQMLARAHAACRKYEQPPFFTLIVDQGEVGSSLLADLSDLAGPYYEVLAIGEAQPTENRRLRFVPNQAAALRAAAGKWIVSLTRRLVALSEYFLSDVYLALKAQHFALARYELLPGIEAFPRGGEALAAVTLREPLRAGIAVRESSAQNGAYYLYGAGFRANQIVSRLGADFLAGCLVTDCSANEKTKIDVPIRQFSECVERLRQEHAVVIVGVMPDTEAEREIVALLQREGIAFLRFDEFRRRCVETVEVPLAAAQEGEMR